MLRTYYIHILTNMNHTVLYIGVTNDLSRSMAEHKAGAHEGFTKQYNVHKLVHFEDYSDIKAAVAREKPLKAGSRAKKLALINQNNPAWEELAK